MIYYSTDKINDWNFEDQNIVKVYRHNAVCYYKMVAGKQEPCYSVVDDITQYSDTEFIDVFDKATSKWYKLNNLNDYEEYGVYGEGRNITYYEGKLTIDTNKEYIYSGSGWTYVGDVSGTTITIMSPEYLEKDASHKGTIMSDKKFTENSKVQLKVHPTNGSGSALFGDYGTSDNNDIRLFWLGSTIYWDLINRRVNTTLSTGNTYELELGNNYIKNLATSAVITSGTRATFASERSCPLDVFGGGVSSNCEPSVTNEYGRLYWFKLYDSDTLVLDLIPYVDNDGYGMFDKVSKTKYPQSTAHPSLTASSVVNEVNVGDSVYPLYYTVKQDPPQNLVFTDMAEAEAYTCPYEGLMATIGGDLYVFSKVGNDYEWVALAYTLSGTTKSSTNFTLKINGADVTANVYEDNGDNTYNWGVVYTDPISSVTQMASGNTNLLTFDWGTNAGQLTSIGDEAFKGCSAMTSISSIPSGVTSISTYSFYECSNLTGITIPSGVTTIGTYAFWRCSGLTSLDLPSSLTSFGTYAFGRCTGLTSISIPYGVRTITDSAFYYCTGLISISIPSGVTSIANSAFYNCSSLNGITLPSGVTFIGSYAFYQCTSLASITIPSGVTTIGNAAFYQCTSLASITIPSGVTVIYDNTFYNCSGLTSIVIPSGVTTIYRTAFSGCKSLTSITMEGTTPPTLGTDVFSNTNNCPIYVPAQSVETYKTETNWSTYADRIVGI